MNNLYDIFNEQQSQVVDNEETRQPRLTKEEFAKKMNDARQELFTKANEQTLDVVSSPNSYLEYLKLQATLGYTVTNTLLVMAQYPQATLLKDTSKWREENHYIRKGEKGIQILTPSGEFQTRNGGIGVNYTPKYVFDISQIQDSKSIKKTKPLNTELLLSALTYSSGIRPQVVDAKSELPRNIYYDSRANIIFVKQGLTPNELLTGLAREYCMIESVNQNVEDPSFVAYSSAYMICHKYQIEGFDQNFANIVYSHFGSKEQRQIKIELEKTNEVFKIVSDRMEQGIYNKQRNQQTRGNVR